MKKGNSKSALTDLF